MNIYDIAREANVSIATVSRVINNHPQVSGKTRDKVNEVLKKHHYTPNAIARGLVVKSMRTIGVLTIDIRDIYYANVAYTIEQEFTKLGYSVILCNTGGDAQQKINYLKMLSEKKVDGLILVGSVFRDKKIDKTISQIAKSLPIVMVNGFLETDNVYSIICDDSYGTSVCVDYLVKKGHRNIVYLQDADTFSAQAKLEGFKKGLVKNHLELTPSSIFKIEKGLLGGYNAIAQLIASNQKFTAVICGEDITGVGVIKKLQELNLNIPNDVAVIGFNNSIIAQCCSPELTSVDNKMETTGIGAVRILNDIFEGRNVPSKTVITPDFIIRKST
ncbi:LacI family DNA-binding transcriptional regulator [Petroclostridium sp. X23]|uniref:LacI family DNA-binding transcriptional regulator n=1 Tax=Petroclostridium sp. X23 TaxID=3045146 RepID=UPI0024AD8AC8|nr:LacI family DNA-binding transcriptional regulator [Petroclostridium sp. X23]WHH60289.1 LacI family DNA-binding transcriptional regulator [Petroclostridium sp. X23]